MVRKFVLTIGLVSLSLFVVSPLASQQEQASEGIRIFHEELDPGQLPDPGQPVQLIVELLNTKDTDRSLKMLATVDGRVMEVPYSKVYLNRHDYPEYQLEVHAPHRELTYQFVLYNEDGSSLLSDRYALRRECSLPLERTVIEPKEGIDETEELNLLVDQARSLLREKAAYTEALRIVESMEVTIKELQNGSTN